MQKTIGTAIIVLITFCTMAAISFHGASCRDSYRDRCFVDSDMPDRNGPSRGWEWVERNGWITSSTSIREDRNINWARWEFDPARSGRHRVLCYNSDEPGLADAIYADGELEVVDVVDQSLYADEWIVLEDFYVPSGRSEVEVRLGDRSVGPVGLDLFAGRCVLYIGAS